MAMYRQRGLKQLSSEVSTEGVGIAGGFIVGGVVGRQVENMLIKVPVDPTSALTDKLMAWVANNGSKAILYYLAKTYDAGSDMTREATKAVAGSIVYDTIIRLANKGVNTGDVTLGGYKVLSAGPSSNTANVQKLVQENSLLRTELNKALQKLAGPVSAPVKDLPGYHPDRPGEFKYAGIPDWAARQARYGSMQSGEVRSPGKPIDALPTSPEVAERQRAYGAMPFVSPDAQERERKFGAMPYGAMPFWSPSRHETRERKYGFSANAEDGTMASMFGML